MRASPVAALATVLVAGLASACGGPPPGPGAPAALPAPEAPAMFGEPTLTRAAYSGTPLFMDLNEDGHADLAMTGSRQNRIAIRFGDGQGGFGAPTRVPVPDLTRPVQPPCNDVGTGYIGGKGLSATAGPPAVGAACGALSDVPSGLDAADMDGDGHLDLLTATRNGDSVAVLRGNGRGGFAAQRRYSTGSGTVPLNVTAADVNGDRAPDVLAHAGDDDVYVMLNDGHGDVSVTQRMRAGTSFAAGDIDGDGDLDILAVEERPRRFARLRVLENDGRARFSRQGAEQIPVRYYRDDGDGFELADVDADGHLDAVLLVSNRRQVLVLPGDRRGGFRAPVRLDTGDADPVAAAVSDVTGDGSPDLVVANRSTYEVVVLAADGSGAFDGPARFPTGGQGPVALFLDDVNADGSLDLIVLHSESRNVSVLLRSGSGG